MTSDAKIGLLLGLIFIFVIAFIINGLPITGQTNSSELTQNSAEFQEQTPGIADRERRAGNFITYDDFLQSHESGNIQPPQQNSNSSSNQPNAPATNNNAQSGPNANNSQGRGFNGGRRGFAGGQGATDFGGAGFGGGRGQRGNNSAGDSQNRQNTARAGTNETTSETPGRGGFNRNNNSMGGNAGFPNPGQNSQTNQSNAPQFPNFNNSNSQQGQLARSETNMPTGEGIRPGYNIPQRQTEENRAANEALEQIGLGRNRNIPGNNRPQPASQQIHVVVDGDSLWKIAKTYYRDTKPSNIDRIYNANRNILSSPDRLSLGQRLVIPPISGNQTPAGTASNMQVPSVRQGRNNAPSVRDTGVWYVVVEGDSLWKIAANKLGSGARFEELADLNTDIISNKDSLKPGMRLRMPVQ